METLVRRCAVTPLYVLPLSALLQNQSTQESTQGISEGTAVIIAAVIGAGLAAVLQTISAFLLNYLAGQREDRAAARDASRLREQWEHDDKIHREEQEQEEHRRRQADRAQAYSKFLAATAVASPTSMGDPSVDRVTKLAALNEAHTRVQAFCSDWTSSIAGQLYDAAYNVMEANTDEELQKANANLELAKNQFWLAVRQEQEDERSTG